MHFCLLPEYNNINLLYAYISILKRFVMENKKYLKGNMMTFPLELTEIGKEEKILDNN